MRSVLFKFVQFATIGLTLVAVGVTGNRAGTDITGSQALALSALAALVLSILSFAAAIAIVAA